MDLNSVIISPVITEKSLKDAGKGKFTFKVSIWADKELVRKAVEEKFGVKVLSVTSSVAKGGRARFGKRRMEVKLPSYKKAQVMLPKGEKIGLFELQAE